jgi:inosine-uridine nucleoside N-ribohydrolase
VTQTKIVIDCDPGHDDAVAILYAARHLELVGITTVHGNNSIENTTRNGLAVLELAAIDVPLAKGCADPLAQPRAAVADVHGKGGLDGADLPVPRRAPLQGHAVDYLIETASRLRGELVLAAIGPQTNVALALRREPRLKDWLREITIMGGSTDRGNITPCAEFNIHCDPEAAWAVFNSGVPLRMVGLNVTRRTGFDAGDIGRMRASGRKVAGVVADLMEFYLARQRERRGVSVAPMHDVCAIVSYVDAGLITYSDAIVDIELTGTHTRGMTVCELPAASGAARRGGRSPNAKVAVAADSRRLIEHVADTLLSYA